jgi:glycosidase
MALAFVMTMRGIPQLYYGTEILMDSPKTRDDGIVRSDFPGGWPGDIANGYTGAGLTTEQKEMQSFVIKLLQWRKTSRVAAFGNTRHYLPEKGVYVLFRFDANEKLMIILNKNSSPHVLELDRFRDMLGPASQAKEVLTGKVVELGDTLVLTEAGPNIFTIK